ncbi:MAG: hypothetical protein V4616_05945 [Bacteroidota bacterium]
MEKERAVWYEDSRKLLLYGGLILFCGTIIISAMPWLFTQKDWGFSGNAATGVIGDTIGGITSPFVSLLGSGLVFLTLLAQVRANSLVNDRLDREEAEKAISQVRTELQQLIEEFRYDVNSKTLKGYKAFVNYQSEIWKNLAKEELKIDGNYYKYVSIIQLLNQLITEISSGKLSSKSRAFHRMLMNDRFDYLFGQYIPIGQPIFIGTKFLPSYATIISQWSLLGHFRDSLNDRVNSEILLQQLEDEVAKTKTWGYLYYRILRFFIKKKD